MAASACQRCALTLLVMSIPAKSDDTWFPTPALHEPVMLKLDDELAAADLRSGCNGSRKTARAPWLCVTGKWCEGSATKVGEGFTATTCQARCTASAACTGFTFYASSCGTGCLTRGCCFLNSGACASPATSSCRDSRLCRNPAAPTPPPPPPLPLTFNFFEFEDKVFPQWRELFRVGDAEAGEFSLLPTRKENRTSFYGTTDMVYALHAAGQLDQLSADVRLRWSQTINRFQNLTTGWYDLAPWEAMHCANPPYANHTWHAAGAAVETLRLLSSSGPAANQAKQPFMPSVPFHSVLALLRAGPDAWTVFMKHWLTNYADVWMGSQAVQSLAAVLKLSHLGLDDGSQSAFFDWFFSFLDQTISSTTGMWDGQPHQPAMQQLGGAFHIFHVYQCFHRSWPDAEASVDTTLTAQDTDSGVWGGHHAWSARSSWKAISSCIDLDGVYSAARGAQLAQTHGQNYRWSDVKAACQRYLRTAEFMLNNASFVLDVKKYGGDTHLLHGPMYAVAECQQHFPHMVETRRPWRRWTSNASCIYA